MHDESFREARVVLTGEESAFGCGRGPRSVLLGEKLLRQWSGEHGARAPRVAKPQSFLYTSASGSWLRPLICDVPSPAPRCPPTSGAYSLLPILQLRAKRRKNECCTDFPGLRAPQPSEIHQLKPRWANGAALMSDVRTVTSDPPRPDEQRGRNQRSDRKRWVGRGS